MMGTPGKLVAQCFTCQKCWLQVSAHISCCNLTESCLRCVLDKHHWVSFDKHASWHASTPSQFVRNDLCGLLPSASFLASSTSYLSLMTSPDALGVDFLKLKE